MAIYYIRKTGNNSNAGTSPGAAWLTFGKALGSAGIASGDTVYVGAGVYREVVTVGMTSATNETNVIADVDGSKTGDAGEVQLTAYTTNDKTAASSSTLLDFSGRDYLTFQDIAFIGGGSTVVGNTGGSTNIAANITFRRCFFISTSNNNTISFTTPANVALNWVIESCIFIKYTNCIVLTFTRPATADFDVNLAIRNCMFIGASGISVSLTTTGANTFNPGGVRVHNCFHMANLMMSQLTANFSTSIPCTVYNSFVYSGFSAAFNAGVLGSILENYNHIYSTTASTNMNAGANSIPSSGYAPLFNTGHEWFSVGEMLKPFGMPKVGSPQLGYGNQASSPTTDIVGTTRPALPSVGAYEIGNTAVKETTVVRTGTSSVKIVNAGYHDFSVPVDAVQTTINIYAQYNGTYTGTKPSMSIVNGMEVGVAAATKTMTGAANQWELLWLTFVPTAAGIITIRIINSTTTTTGVAYFDDFYTT